MTRRKSQKATEDEALIQQALDGLKKGLYQSVRHASHVLSIPRSTLQHRVNGRRSRTKAHADNQKLTTAEETELVRWITQLTITGYPPRHPLLRSMAETIRKRRVPQIEEDLQSDEPLGID